MTSRQFVLRLCLRTLIVFSLLPGVFGVAANEEPVSVKEGDCVTLYTDVKANKSIQIKWYFNKSRIASLSKICTDEECLERFRDGLTVDSHAGDLTITNIRPEHAGVYQLKISGHIRRETSFPVTVQGVPAAERDAVTKICVKEGESVTLDPSVMKNPKDTLTWLFNDTRIAEITGDQSQICTDDQCDGRFRDRLKLDHQTGSLTITDIRITDTGDYTLQIIVRIHRRHSITTSVESFRVAVIGSGLSAGVVAGIYVTVVLLLLVFAASGVIYCRHRTSKSTNEEDGVSGDLRESQQHQGLLTSILPLAKRLKDPSLNVFEL